MNPWVSFLLRRTTRVVVAMLVIVTIAFGVLRLAGGDPVRAALGPTAPASVVDERRAQLGLDDPVLEQYVNYLGDLLHGDLGTSLVTGRSVSDLVGNRLMPTLELAGLAFVVALVFAVLIGLCVAVFTQGHRRRGLELAFTGVSGFLAAIPEYLLGVLLVIGFAITVAVFPVAGQGGPDSYVLPVIALAVSATAGLSRIARIEALNTLRDDYVRTARAKRIPPWRVYLRHALPNMLTGTLTIGGTLLATMITSSVLVEQVFNWPGMGTAFVQAIVTKDYGIVQGLALVYAAIVLVVNLLVDLVLALLDRRTTLLETG
ncbi:peptide ABC transporter permease [Actinophytocola xinjiangensis]|uniref:Peptide ABC transporter permease n=1 Tax=Actinophytocola xinjiangensis TaxID=485602 RepID=A0A7Z0WEX9_9PSEU|nr:ABC transporter permease [Actinophytocola xinjiangensis]OLF05753.1 peptide ABC transporter permease [Actinophytocola xinjiangensis]